MWHNGLWPGQGAHKCCKAVPGSVQHHLIAWNSDVLTIAARLCPYLDHSYVTATAEATQVYNYYCSNCPIWLTTERSKFLFMTSLFSVVGQSLAPFVVLMGSCLYIHQCAYMLLYMVTVQVHSDTITLQVYTSHDT